MERLFGRPIVTQEQMRARIREIGRQITADYGGKELILVGVLKGAYAILCRPGAGDPDSDEGRLPGRNQLWLRRQDFR